MIIDGKSWRLRERPTIIPTIPTNPEQTKTKDQQTQTSPINLSLHISPISPAESGQSSEGSVDTYYKCYIPPDINESNAESVGREREIQRRVNKRKRDKHISERSKPDPAQRSGLRDTWLSIDIEPIPPHLMSLTVEEGRDIGDTPHKIIKLLPISAHEETNHRTILLHQPTPYELLHSITISQSDDLTSPRLPL